MRIFVQLLSWHHGDVFALLLKITQHLFEYHIGATRLVNLGLPKAFIQLFRMQVHVPYIQVRCDVLFQIRFCDFSGVLLYSQAQTTCFKVTACNLKDCNPDVQSQQSM